MRLYRFKDLIGNRSSIKMLEKSLERNTLPNFIILNGSPGTGKSTSAEITGLRLTCINPDDSEPCLKCESCRSNLKALKTTGESYNLVKKNLGLTNTKKDIEQIIKEIFVLKGSVGNSVYILEEAHSLGKNEQTALLEEIDRLDANTYIIICTTKPYALLPELRSRAISFNFSSLNSEDLNILFDRTCKRLGMPIPDSATKQMLINYSKGVPRDLVNIIDFVRNNAATVDEIKEFLGEIPYTLFIDLFKSMSEDLSYVVPLLENMLNTINVSDLTYRLKEFLIDSMFYLEGGINGRLSIFERKEIKTLFSIDTLTKILNVFGKLDTKTITDIDFKYTIIKVYKLIHKSNIGAIYTNNNKDASKQTYRSSKVANEVQEFEEAETGVLKELTAFDLD